MENFEGLRNIDNFCTVTVRKGSERLETGKANGVVGKECRENLYGSSMRYSSGNGLNVSDTEEPLVDVFDEEDHVRILVQCRCREQEVTFHPNPDGLTVCKEECHREKGGPEECHSVCRKVSLPTEALQLENRLFIVAKCNNNNTLEAMIPKVKSDP